MKKLKANIQRVFVAVGLTVAGLIVVPPLVRKLSNRAYKSGSKTTEQDFIDNAPEIVRKNKEENENDD